MGNNKDMMVSIDQHIDSELAKIQYIENNLNRLKEWGGEKLFSFDKMYTYLNDLREDLNDLRSELEYHFPTG
jgi:hypothetical protein